MLVPTAREHPIEKQFPISQPRQAQLYVCARNAAGVSPHAPCLSTENER
jgi:hypothetical protein